MKLLKKDRLELEATVQKLRRGLSFLMRDDVAIMRETNLSSNDVFSSVLSNKKYSSICKDIGSEFTLVLTALSELEKILNEKSISAFP
jgi:hypothetical protein